MKKRGRPRLQEGEIRKQVCSSMDKSTYDELQYLSKDLGMSQSQVIKYLIQQAKKDKVLRCLLVHDYVMDLRTKHKPPVVNQLESGNYVTKIKEDGTLYTQPQDFTSIRTQKTQAEKPVSNEEIDKLFDELYGPNWKEESK